jgi:SAM-dependent methyltransferase
MNKWDNIFLQGIDFARLNELFFENLFQELAKRLGRAPRTLIDLGAGTGDTLLKFGRKGVAVTGVDFSQVALQKADEVLHEAGIQAKLIVVDFEELEKIEGIYDVIFSKLAYAFVKDKQKFFRNIKNLMHEKSLFVLMTPVLHTGITYAETDKPEIAVDFEETKKLLKQNFKSVEEFNHHYFGERGDRATFLANG